MFDKKSYMKDYNKVYGKEWRRINFMKKKELDKNYYLTHKDKIKLMAKNYRLNNKERRKNWLVKYNLVNKSFLKEKRRLYHIKNRLKICAKSRKYYRENRMKVLLRTKEYIKTEKYKKNRRSYMNDRYATDCLVKLQYALSNSFRKGLKYNDLTKRDRLFKLLGYTVIDLKSHLEKQFQVGMSWKNFGFRGWHIDHKIPICFARTETELIVLYQLDNLQPLWAKDNLTKNKYAIADLFGVRFE